MKSKNESILVVDDSPAVLTSISEMLVASGYAVDVAPDGETGAEMINAKFYDIILTDLVMPGMDGMQVLKYVSENSQESICVMVTGHGTIKSAVEAMRLGAFDYLTKPVTSAEILICIERALEYRNLKRENTSLKKQLDKRYVSETIIGYSERIQEVFRLIEKVAQTDSTVLITGESGTGKELVARAIHHQSDRKDKQFVPVNCAAIPEELLESELFGHEKGAFTDAIRTRIGRFELAGEGTIFLDEIGDMSPNLQVKILRVLQERQFERIGGVRTIKADIRIIAATNRNLKQAMQTGKFREDLYYRLNVVPIYVPALRERKSDIPFLAQHFLEKLSKSTKKNIRTISKEVLQRFATYHWPGNVRELEHIIERLMILTSSDQITSSDLPAKLCSCECEENANCLEIPEEGISLYDVVDELEKCLIIQALGKSGWVKQKAADLLSIKRTTLIQKMKKLHLMDRMDSILQYKLAN